MAETSGFFDAEQLTDNTYDREYVAEQFANYFKLFIGNGVFASPTNQLQVIKGDALHVVVKAGWAFINGYWYHNSEDKIISIVPNASTNDRTDSIMARLDKTSRTISVIALMSTTDPVRTDPYYDLQLAKVFIPSGAQSISQAYITDMRTNEDVCGFVKGLVDVISSADLFAQFTSQFSTWFDAMKGQLTTDAAGHLQTEIDGLQTVDTKHETNFASAFDTAKTTYKTGMYCIYNNTLYRFTADKPSTGWDASKVTAISLADAVASNATNITDLQNKTAPLIYNGAAHNGIYRGKNLGTSVTAAQYTAISAGTFDDLYIGDYWTIGGVNYRIASFDYYLNCGDSAVPPHHAVILPEKNLYNAEMNTTDTTTGGYVASRMRSTNLAQAKTTIKAAFSGHVVKNRIYLVNAVTNGYSSGGAWVDSEVDLMNEQMVYGSGIFSPVSTGSAVPANYRVEKNQLPLFAMNPAMLNTQETYWLRDVITASDFARVGNQGFAGYYGASTSFGVRPAFCIS